MKRESEINTAAGAAASGNFQPPPPAPALALNGDDLDELRGLLRSITDTAGDEAASESALDVCGRYAYRALELVNERAAAAAAQNPEEDDE